MPAGGSCGRGAGAGAVGLVGPLTSPPPGPRGLVEPDQRLAVGQYGECLDPPAYRVAGRERPLGDEIPDPESSLAISGGQESVVAAERQGGHTKGVLLELLHQAKWRRPTHPPDRDR